MYVCTGLPGQLYGLGCRLVARLFAAYERVVLHVGIVAPGLLLEFGCVGRYDALVLAVQGDEGGRLTENALYTFLLIYEHAARAASHEELHSTYGARVYTAYLPDIVGRGAKVETVVDEAFLLRIGKLGLKGLDAGGLRTAVGHIHYRGDTSPCCCTALAGHVGLVGETRVAEVYVVVDTSRQQVLSRSVYCVVGYYILNIGAADDGSNLVVLDEQTASVLLAFIDDGGVVDEGGHFLSCVYKKSSTRGTAFARLVSCVILSWDTCGTIRPI